MSEETFEQIRAAISVLSIKDGDILIVDGTQLHPDDLYDVLLHGITKPVPVIVSFPRGEATIEQALRTCDLDTLKRIVAEMESR